LLVSEYSKEKKDLEDRLEGILKGHVSRGAFVAGRTETDKGTYFNIGISYPEFIVDREGGPILTYIPISGIGTASLKREGNTYHLAIKDRAAIFREFNKKRTDLVKRAENLIIRSGARDLIRIPKIQNGLNPIKEILLSIRELDRVPVKDILSRKDNREQMQRYVDMLSNLGYTVERDGMLHPGEEMEKFEVAGVKNLREEMLADVVQRGFHYIRDDLRIYIMNPYLELTNAYYLPSLLAEESVQMKAEDIETYYIRWYGRSRRKPMYQIFSNLMEIAGVGLLKRRNDTFEADEKMFETLKNGFVRSPA